ncbi:CocE/NonD family hydrolase [Streptomyces chilikensis]|uniref:CocE/NonD family hydrolase n=1 Tax=Streptomyces chilikensis TaxID=1194079 RepID=UPI00140B1587|nr:CocE/NonD family hydrolase [Streptomyces chilikensis]
MRPHPNDAPTRTGWTPPGGRPPLSSRLLRATWRGLPGRRYRAGRERSLPVAAADGSVLVTDHYFPRSPGDFPTLLVRSPYGRGLPWSPMYGVLFAEQGFHVVLQSCRGTGGSGGRWHLWRNESADALATVEWLRRQVWFDGRLGTVGPSCLGYTQWALAADPPPELKAMAVQVGLHDPHRFFHAGGALHLENALISGVGMTHQHRGVLRFAAAANRLRRDLGRIAAAWPMRPAWRRALGEEARWLDDALSHPDADDPYWDGASPEGAADGSRVPTALVTGFHDALAGQSFEQYARLRAAGCEVSLLAGPWTHGTALQQGWAEGFAEMLAWLRAHLCDDPSALRPTRVRVHVGGANVWRDLDDWPPAADPSPWFAAPAGRLGRGRPEAPGLLASFRYDPADPTPSVGGPLLSPGAGPRDNRALEAREDVITFTGEPLTAPLEVVGPVSALVRVSADSGRCHVFVRLCDVDGRGRSVNVCDGLGVLDAEREAVVELAVPMGAAAHRFAAGHRIRWQVSGGAHPRFARHPGTADPVAEAAAGTPVRITLRPGSALLLPETGEVRPSG